MRQGFTSIDHIPIWCRLVRVYIKTISFSKLDIAFFQRDSRLCRSFWVFHASVGECTILHPRWTAFLRMGRLWARPSGRIWTVVTYLCWVWHEGLHRTVLPTSSNTTYTTNPYILPRALPPVQESMVPEDQPKASSLFPKPVTNPKPYNPKA